MSIQIECIEAKRAQPNIYMAHLMEEDGYRSRYKCGVCSYGDIFVDSKTNNLSITECVNKGCRATIKKKV